MTEKEEKVLEVKNLHVHFKTYAGKVKAIRDVSFDLKKGETLAIVGESGSGKSVTTKTLMGLNAANAEIPQGEILFKGRNLLDIKEEDWQKIRGNEISMIFQDPMTSLDPTMRIGNQIAEPLIKHRGMKKKEALVKALELMKAVGIPQSEQHINDYPHQWSGGMRQRAVIAIALAADPEILIADEPTTALDVTIQAQIMQMMSELQQRIESSIIFITHDLGVVAGFADRVAVMYAGEIVEYGTVEEIFYNPQHPYTWGLLDSMPTVDTDVERLVSIPGTPPDLLNPPKGDAFALRNQHALEIDFEEEPPYFEVSPTHQVKSWLLDERSPKVLPSENIQQRWTRWEKIKMKGDAE